MTDDMREFDLPAGWRAFAAPGWPVLGADWAEVGAPVPYSAGSAPVPEHFQLVIDTDERLLVLLFQVRDRFAELAGVLTSGNLEVPAALSLLTRHRSIEWWKSKAIWEVLTKSDADFLSEIDPQLAGEALERVSKLLEERRSIVKTAPARRTRASITSQRLDDVARLYMAAVDRGSRSPTRDVREALNAGKRPNEGLSYSHVAHLVADARKAGKIPPAK